MHSRKALLLGAVVVAVAVFLNRPAWPQESVQGIAAVVNDEIISAYDVQSRLRMIISSSDLPDTPEIHKRLLPQVLRGIIDESLQIQEAKKQGVQATVADIDRAKESIEINNGLPKGKLDEFLAQKGVDVATLESQLEATLSWAKLRDLRLRPRVQISPEEVDERMRLIAATEGKPEHLVSEIVLPVDNPRKDGEMRRLAERLAQQVRQGADFQALASSFSKAASAAKGGNIGWIRQGEVDPNIDAALARLQPGQVSEPVRTISGYHLLLLRDRRTGKGLQLGPPPKVTLQQVFLPVAPNATSDQVRQTADRLVQLSRPAKSCNDLEKVGASLGTRLSGNLGQVAVTDLTDRFRTAVADVPLATPTVPIRTEQGIVVLMVCEKTGGASQEAVRQRVEKMLVDQRVERASQGLMQELRRNALVDIRL